MLHHKECFNAIFCKEKSASSVISTGTVNYSRGFLKAGYLFRDNKVESQWIYIGWCSDRCFKE